MNVALTTQLEGRG